MSLPPVLAHHMGEDLLLWALPAGASALPLLVVVGRARLERLRDRLSDSVRRR